MEKKKIILARVYVFFFLLLVFAFFIGFQIVNIQYFKSAEIVERVKTTSAGYRPVPADRGDIYASDGSLLATSLHNYIVGMDLHSKALTNENFNLYLGPLCDSLSVLLGEKSSDQYKVELVQARKERRGWYKISNEMTYPQFKRLRKFPLYELGRYKSGLVYKKEIVRERPFDVLAERTIGKKVPYGLEGAYNHYLSGTSGEQYQRKIPGGVWVSVNDRNSVDPQDGYDVYSTIDIGMQEIVNNALKDQLLHHRADHGCAIVMETSTGKIKAIANLKVDTMGNAGEQWNYAVGDAVEPGSTFKLASMMALLEDKHVALTDMIDVGFGVEKYYDRKMRDSHLYNERKIMSVREVFEASSNVGIAQMVTKAYGDNPQEFIDRLFGFRLNEKLDLKIHGEPSPKIKNPSQKDQWSGITLPWMSIGYEVALTPLQILSFYNAVANDGNLLRPTFVEKVCDKQEVVVPFSPKLIKKAICSKETLQQVQSLLEGVVLNGTAKKGFKGTPYSVAGKTGTAQLNYWSRKKGEKKQYIASFAGYFPADKPTYTCIVMVTNPTRNGFYGSQVALPVFRKISDRLYSTSPSLRRVLAKEKVKEKMLLKGGAKFDYETVAKKLSLPTLANNIDGEWVQANYSNKLLEVKTKKMISKGVPNVKSLGLRDAVYLLENAGLNVVVKGSGKVVKQSLQPGSKIIRGKTIELILA
ncbi:MAG: cell division protein FtsI (penicillin-binding protein 3) [Glaciecola sp.]|jgi:cell division protein FtsI (penicillin-binding protein 3)